MCLCCWSTCAGGQLLQRLNPSPRSPRRPLPGVRRAAEGQVRHGHSPAVLPAAESARHAGHAAAAAAAAVPRVLHKRGGQGGGHGGQVPPAGAAVAAGPAAAAAAAAHGRGYRAGAASVCRASCVQTCCPNHTNARRAVSCCPLMVSHKALSRAGSQFKCAGAEAGGRPAGGFRQAALGGGAPAAGAPRAGCHANAIFHLHSACLCTLLPDVTAYHRSQASQLTVGCHIGTVHAHAREAQWVTVSPTNLSLDRPLCVCSMPACLRRCSRQGRWGGQAPSTAGAAAGSFARCHVADKPHESVTHRQQKYMQLTNLLDERYAQTFSQRASPQCTPASCMLFALS